MKNIRLLQEPGFLWDLYYMFFLRFNLDTLSSVSPEEDGELLYCKDMVKRFADIPEDLYVFFRRSEKNNSTLVYEYYLKKFQKHFSDRYNVEYLQHRLVNWSEVIRNTISFYFDDVAQEELDKYASSKELLFDRLKNSDYSSEYKIKLYEFFINPEHYIKLLQRVLVDKISLLNDYYKECYRKIMDVYDPVQLNSFAESTDNVEREVYVSYCIVDHKHFEHISDFDKCLYILGTDYEKGMEKESRGAEKLALKNFCYALSESNRVDILNLLLEKGEITCKDLERFFDFSGSTAYHHISLMSRMGVVETRNKGKTIYYSINKRTLNDIVIYLKRFSN